MERMSAGDSVVCSSRATPRHAGARAGRGGGQSVNDTVIASLGSPGEFGMGGGMGGGVTAHPAEWQRDVRNVS